MLRLPVGDSCTSDVRPCDRPGFASQEASPGPAGAEQWQGCLRQPFDPLGVAQLAGLGCPGCGNGVWGLTGGANLLMYLDPKCYHVNAYRATYCHLMSALEISNGRSPWGRCEGGPI